MPSVSFQAKITTLSPPNAAVQTVIASTDPVVPGSPNGSVNANVIPAFHMPGWAVGDTVTVTITKP